MKKTIDPRLDAWPARVAKPELVEILHKLKFIEKCALDKALAEHMKTARVAVEKALARIG